jgi:BirA family biotin operon repressor/biotin-[acetyl-CoA-carboxylase] ligase
MTTARAEWHLDTCRLGRRVLVFDTIDSTNGYAARLAAEGATEGIAVLAEEQTSGRGQHGRSWLADRGDGVLLSVLLAPPPPLRVAALMTGWAAVTVCQLVREITGIQARIKWPNDVLIRGKKVCGILIEQGRGCSGLMTVAGIGLNVRQLPEAFAAAGLPDATSLAHFVAAPQTTDVARRLIRLLDDNYEQLCTGDVATLEACWRWHVGLLGRTVIAECSGQTFQGRLLDMTFHGIELEQPGAAALLLRPERILHLRATDGRS